MLIGCRLYVLVIVNMSSHRSKYVFINERPNSINKGMHALNTYMMVYIYYVHINLLGVASSLHGDNAELVLLVDPHQKGLGIVVVDTAALRPVTCVNA